MVLNYWLILSFRFFMSSKRFSFFGVGNIALKTGWLFGGIRL
jgi:hypothetical protein